MQLEKNLSTKDTLALAFGCMVGWGWVVLVGVWVAKGGSIGAVGGFVAASAILLVVALLYAELASAMPLAGGAQVYSWRAFGDIGAFVCGWSLIFAYVSITTFEAVALPQVIEYLVGDLNQVALWSIAGKQVYLSFAAVGVFGSVLMGVINIVGVKTSAVLQTTVTLVILLAGVLLMTGAVTKGDMANLDPWFVGGSAAGIMAVMVMAPFLMGGFDVIPQAAEEINLPPRKIGHLIVYAVVMGGVWYCCIILAVAMIFDGEQLAAASLPAVDAAEKVWGSWGGTFLILGGLAGIVTSWNGFVMGGSRSIYALAKMGLLPKAFTRLHPKYKTPYNAVLLITLLGCIAPFFGRQIMVWLANAGSFGFMLAYLLVALSFLSLRKNEPNMARPFVVPYGRYLGWLGVIGSLGLCLLYLPISPGALVWPSEWAILIMWYGLGAAAFLAARLGRQPMDLGVKG